jgi:hypothetical protein
MFEVLDATSHPVTVNFMATLSGSQSLMTDPYGTYAASWDEFDLIVYCTTFGRSYVSFLSIGPHSMAANTQAPPLLSNTEDSPRLPV